VDGHARQPRFPSNVNRGSPRIILKRFQNSQVFLVNLGHHRHFDGIYLKNLLAASILSEKQTKQIRRRLLVIVVLGA